MAKPARGRGNPRRDEDEITISHDAPHEGFFAESRVVSDGKKWEDGGRFLPCRTWLYPSSAAEKPNRQDNKAPESDLNLEAVFTYNGHDARDNAHFLNDQEIVFHSAGTAVVQNLKTKQQRFYFGHDDDITALSVHTESGVAASGQCGKPVLVCIWDTASMGTYATLSGPFTQRVAAMGWSCNGRYLAVIAQDEKRSIFVMDCSNITNPFLVFSGPVQPAPVFGLSFHPNRPEEFLVVGDKYVASWSISSKRGQKLSFRDTNAIRSAFCSTFVGEGGTVVTGMAKGDIYVWNGGALAGAVKQAHKGKCTAILSISVENPVEQQQDQKSAASKGVPKGNTLVARRKTNMIISGGADGWIHSWLSDSNSVMRQLEGGQPLQRWQSLYVRGALPSMAAGWPVSLDYQEESSILLIGMSTGALFWVMLSALEDAKVYPDLDTAVRHAQSSVWAGKRGGVITAGHSGPCCGVDSFVAAGTQRCVTAADDGSIRIWDLESNACIGCAQIPIGCKGVAVSPNNNFLAVGHVAGYVSFWKMETMYVTALDKRFEDDQRKRQATALAKDSGAWDSKPNEFWRGDTLQKGARGAGSKRSMGFSSTSLDSSKRSKSFGSVSGEMRMLKGAPAAPKTPFELCAEKRGCIFLTRDRLEDIDVVRISPSGKILAAASHDNFIDLYRITLLEDGHANVKKYATCTGHSSYVTHIDFSIDETLLQSTAGDNELLYWNTNDGKQNPQTFAMRETQWSTVSCPLGWNVRSIWPPGSDGTDINALDRSLQHDALVTADDLGLVKLFRWPATGTRAVSKAYKGHSSHVANIKFSLDGHTVLSCGGADRSLLMWNHFNRINIRAARKARTGVTSGTTATMHQDVVVDAASESVKDGQEFIYEVRITNGQDSDMFTKGLGLSVELVGDNIRSGKKELLAKSGSKFKSGSTDSYSIAVGGSLGNISRMILQCESSSGSLKWLVDQVEVELLRPNKQGPWVFPAKQWMDSRNNRVELYSGESDLERYHLSVQTGPNSKNPSSVYAILYGPAADSGRKLLRTCLEKRQPFKAEQTDTFEIIVNPPLNEITKMRLLLEDTEHPFTVEKAILRRSGCNDLFFSCHRALDATNPFLLLSPSETDETFTYSLNLQAKDKSSIKSSNLPVVKIWFDDKTSLPSMAIKSLSYSKEDASTCSYSAQIKSSSDMGQPSKIEIRQAAEGTTCSLSSIQIICPDGQQVDFPIHAVVNNQQNILTILQGSASVCHSIIVKTGSKMGAGTDANVWCRLNGKNLNSAIFFLKESKENSNKFERKSVDTFMVDVVGDLGDLDSIDIGHDGSGLGADWLLDSVVIKNEVTGKQWNCFADKWLNAGLKEVNLMASTDALMSKYTIQVFTSDVSGAGTDANVFIELKGKDYQFEEKQLLTSSDNSDKFERGNRDTFEISFPRHLGDLESAILRIDSSGLGADWKADKVIVTCSKGVKSAFIFDRWLSKKFPSAEVKATLESEYICYKLSVVTGKVKKAGTDANVFAELIDKNGQTSGERKLSDSETHTDKFERGHTDIFHWSLGAALDGISTLKIRHDGSGWGSSWFLDHVIIEVDHKPDNYEGDMRLTFPCKRWITKQHRSVDLIPGDISGFTYFLHVHTGDLFRAGTDSNVFVEFGNGEVGSGEHALKESKTHSDKFERGHTDVFEITVPKRLPEITQLRIWHDKSGFGSDWNLEKVLILDESAEAMDELANEMDDDSASQVSDSQSVTTTGSGSSRGKTWAFVCRRWLRGDNPEVTLFVGEENALHQYEVEVKTADVAGAGTDANIFLEVHGSQGSTGKHALAKSTTHTDKFEKGHRDVFHIETNHFLGKLDKIEVWLESKSDKDRWHLDEVMVSYIKPKKLDSNALQAIAEGQEMPDSSTTEEPTGITVFPFKAWLDPSDNHAQILPNGDVQTIRFKVATVTGKERGAGTDANVWCQLHGENGSTSKHWLRESAEHSDKFEKGHTDSFSLVHVGQDIGAISSINIGHDNTGVNLLSGAKWLLEKVTVAFPESTSELAEFVCKQWLRDDHCSCHLQRSSSKDTELTIRVVTDAKRGSGTDGNVFLEILGEEGSNGKQKLSRSQNTDKFETGQTDIFKQFYRGDLGDIRMVVVYFEPSFLSKKWRLDHVAVDNPLNGQTLTFPCKQLFSSKTVLKKVIEPNSLDSLTFSDDEGDSTSEGLNSARSAASKSGFQKCKYTIRIVTGDVKNAGTDANVFLRCVGTQGELSERPLKNSLTFRDKFERGHTDVFEFEETTNIGDITDIHIRHDNANFRADWFLKEVVVERDIDKYNVKFQCNDWLAKSKTSLPQKHLHLDPKLPDSLEEEAALAAETGNSSAEE